MERNLRACKVCGIQKLRIENDKFNHKDKRWIDEKGKIWMGNICPPCNVIRANANMKKLRASKLGK
jgi:hypothetical protein